MRGIQTGEFRRRCRGQIGRARCHETTAQQTASVATKQVGNRVEQASHAWRVHGRGRLDIQE
jgi:hypothetical protein